MEKQYKTIEDRLKTIEENQKIILEILSNTDAAQIRLSKLVGVTEIADMLGVSRPTLYTTQRYRLPNFGKSNQDGSMRWTLQEVLDWNKQPEAELRERYKNIAFE